MNKIVSVLLWICRKIVYYHHELWKYDGTNRAGFKLFCLISFTFLILPQALVSTYLLPHSYDRKNFLYNEAESIINEASENIKISEKIKAGTPIFGRMIIRGHIIGTEEKERLDKILVSRGWEKIDEGPGEYSNIVKRESYYLSKNYYESDFRADIFYMKDNSISIWIEEVNYLIEKMDKIGI